MGKKALSDVICSSSNAKVIVESFPKEQAIIFASSPTSLPLNEFSDYRKLRGDSSLHHASIHLLNSDMNVQVSDTTGAQ